MENNKQLYEKIGNEYKEVFPLNFIENIVDKVSGKTLAEIIASYNNIYVPYKGTTEATRNAIPVLLRRRGLWISYNAGDKSITEKYIGTTEDVTSNWGSDNNWEKIPDVSLVQIEAGKLPDGIITPSKLSPALQQLINEHKTIYNLPDDEDLEEVNNVIRFKDREYNPLLDNSKGYKILRRNWIGGKNVLTQEMINDINTIYEIRYDFDLNGKEITIPEGCVLEFKGGSFSNGNIIGNNSSIINNFNNLIFKDIEIKGSWIIDNVYSNWFNFSEIENYDNIINFRNIMILAKSDITTNIYIQKGIFYTSTYTKKDSGGYKNNIGINIPSNVYIYNNATIKAIANSYEKTSIFYMENVENIIIDGGKIIGDVRTHTGTTGEWGNGIYPNGVRNLTIKNIEISECWGDGIDIQSLYSDYENGTIDGHCYDILIDNVKCLNNRRQGLSIEGCINCTITNSEFSFTGNIKNTLPSCGIDIEPWFDTQIVKNVLIDNCQFYNNIEHGILMSNNINRFKTDNINHITVRNCIFKDNKKNSITATRTTNLFVHNNKFYNRFEINSYKYLFVENNSFFKTVAIFNNNDSENGIFQNNVIEHNYDNVILVNIIKNNVISCSKLEFYQINSVIINNIININNSISEKSIYNINAEIKYIDNIIFTDKPIIFQNNGNFELINNVFNVKAIIGQIPDTYIGKIINNIDISNNKTFFINYSTSTTKYIIVNNIQSNYIKGLYEDKPNTPTIGYSYFCTDKQTSEGATNGIMIYHKGNNVWVDALGRVVS